MVHVRVGVCENVEPTGSGTTSDNGKEGGREGGELDTIEATLKSNAISLKCKSF